MGGFPILSVLIFFPIVAGLGITLFNRSKESVIKGAALVISLLNFIFSLHMLKHFDKTTSTMQFVERRFWIPTLDINYFVGIDGISILMIMLSTLITILCILVSWYAIHDKIKEFYVGLLLVEGAMIGVFCSLDLFLFYIFWEAMLIPMFLLIGVWGGANRRYATIKFFLYTLVGSVLMLVGIIVLYELTGTFDLIKLMSLNLPYKLQLFLFWAFFAAFAVKVPMFPVHTWLPDAHTEAPTAGSVILAAILIKMGAYGFLRFSLPLCPQAAISMTPIMLVLSVIAIIYGGLICLIQTDIKRLIAYSSVSHMGFVTLGIFALNTQGVEGGLLQMINHGIITGALFLCIGIIYERTHTRQIKDYGGLARFTPVYAGLFLVFTFAAIGLPGTNGFVGEFLVILGGFKANRPAGIMAATGIIIGAAYMLWLYLKVFFATPNEALAVHKDLSKRELAVLLPLLFLVFYVGLYPNSLLSYMHQSVSDLLMRVNMNEEAQAMSIVHQFYSIF
ncbi:MAG: NADH-quinone oxidoreductase subunit M [Nitrospirae bacterium]|nr:NADH-quinone oxidoreductase subunit M [Nitrospirota bacterium]